MATNCANYVAFVNCNVDAIHDSSMDDYEVVVDVVLINDQKDLDEKDLVVT